MLRSTWIRATLPTLLPLVPYVGKLIHKWSREGNWVGYTYNDAIMKKLEDSGNFSYFRCSKLCKVEKFK